jgi:hypothetical protein
MEITKTQAKYVIKFFGEREGGWDMESARQMWKAATAPGQSRGWALALRAWSELEMEERQQRNELTAIIRYAQSELSGMDKGYRVDTTWIESSHKKLAIATDKIARLCEQLNSYVLILTSNDLD